MGPCFNGFPIPADVGLWLQWSRVQVPSLTLPSRNNLLESGEFCAWPKLNTRGYPCTLGVPTASVLQKGYPLAQAHCTAFTSPPVVFMCFAVAPDQTAMAACTAPRRCADCVGNTT